MPQIKYTKTKSGTEFFEINGYLISKDSMLNGRNKREAMLIAEYHTDCQISQTFVGTKPLCIKQSKMNDE